MFAAAVIRRDNRGRCLLIVRDTTDTHTVSVRDLADGDDAHLIAQARHILTPLCDAVGEFAGPVANRTGDLDMRAELTF